VAVGIIRDGDPQVLAIFSVAFNPFAHANLLLNV
jgi:hypothetical protein